MIDRLAKFKYKSWKDESNLSSINFNNTNIIFGYNGSGKSSLAHTIAKEYLATNNKNTARFFSAKYVEATLMLEDKSGIRGVVSSFGKKDVDIEKKVDANSKRIDNLKADISIQTTLRQDLTSKTEKLIEDIVRRRKDKNTKIHNKPKDKTVQEKVDLWTKDYDEAVKIFPDEDYNVLTGNADFSAESEQVNRLEFPIIPELDKEINSSLADILAEEYKSIEVPEREVVNWLQGGLHIHEDKQKCEFCGADISIDAIKKRVDIYLNNDRHKAAVKLETYKKALLELHGTAKTLVDNCDTYRIALGLVDNTIKFDDVLINMVQILAVVNESIDRKIRNMESSLSMDDKVLPDAIKNITDTINSLESAKKQTSQNLLEKVNRLETLVKGAIGLEVKSTNSINDNLAEIKASNDQTKKLVDEQKKFDDQNQRLLEQKSDLADFAEYLNVVLKDLCLNFTLSPSGNVYVLKHANGTPIKLADISDGERNLLSLIYFYYEMHSDLSGIFKNTIELIVIDDPISSLDDNNKFYITELVRSILDQQTAQVFVFTHSWDDFCNLSYGRCGDEISLFEIKKEASLSGIYPIGNKKLLKPYIMLYREVDAFRSKDSAKITDEEALHMPNTIRRVIEEYVKFNVDVDFATAAKTGDISKALFKDELVNLSATKKQKLSQLLAICNILSHKANQPKNPSEIHESAKFLMNSIEQHDKFHHLKMKGN